MSKHRFAHLFWLLLLIAIPARADDKGIVKMPEGDVAWTVSISYPKTHASPGDPESKKPDVASSPIVRPVKVDYTRVGKLSRAQLTWSDNGKTEVWRLDKDKVTIIEYPGGQVIHIFTDAEASTIKEFLFPLGISAFDWVSSRYDDGEKSFQGKNTKHYQGDIPLSELFGYDISGKLQCQAWVEPETLRPVALYNQLALYVFAFSPDKPTSMLTMPDRIQKEWTSYEKTISRIKPLGTRR